MKPNCSRREFLGAMGMAAGAAIAHPRGVNPTGAIESRRHRNVLNTTARLATCFPPCSTNSAG